MWLECSYVLTVLHLYSDEERSFITVLEVWIVFKEILCEPGVARLKTKIRVAIPTFLCRYRFGITHNFL